jgi:hypothetical protein
LGNLPGYFSIGEVQHIWKYLSWKQVRCGCGVTIEDCPFWSQALEELSITEDQINRLAGLTKLLNRTRNVINLDNLFVESNESFQELRGYTEKLYRAIGKFAPNQIIVDSSKTPSHLMLLSKIPSVDLRILHLVRDARAVAYSWNRRSKRKLALSDQNQYMDKRPVLITLLRWTVENGFASKWGRKLENYSMMRYEDFTAAPQEELIRALKEIGLVDIDISLLESEGINLNPTHSIGGNPDRFQKAPLKIRHHEEWRTNMGALERLSLGILAAPALMKYGYKIR